MLIILIRYRTNILNSMINAPFPLIIGITKDGIPFRREVVKVGVRNQQLESACRLPRELHTELPVVNLRKFRKSFVPMFPIKVDSITAMYNY